MLAAAVAVTVGCRHSSRPTLEVRADPPPSVGAKASASAAPPPKLCASIVDATRRAFASAAHKWLGDAGTFGSWIGWCAESPAGAWALELPDLTAVTDAHGFEYAVEARFVVAFHPRGGAPVRHVPKDPFADYGVRSVSTPWTFDYDGDGVPELFVEAREEGEEGHRAARIELLTFRGGAIAPYAPATGIAYVGARDVDGDGRPELILHAGYTEALEGCGSGFEYDRPEPWFIAHALPDGTFSRDDAAAKAFVRKSCPASPSSIASSFDAMCARLWAKDVAKERARVLASCTHWSCDDANAGKPQKKSATEDCERRARFFDRTPPFTLP